jgi:hypothetical protein
MKRVVQKNERGQPEGLAPFSDARKRREDKRIIGPDALKS